MDLIKKDISICRRKQQLDTQTVINEDLNLPDYMEDIEKTITEKGEFIPAQIVSGNNKIILKGKLKYTLLYTGGESEEIYAFTKEINVDEEINIDGVDEHDEASVYFREESFKISIINSRKINVKMILGLKVIVEEFISESVACELSNAEGFEVKRNDEKLLRLVVQNNDIFRFNKLHELPLDKPNIENVLYECITPSDIEIKCADSSISIDGRIYVFFMYVPEGRNTQIQWYGYDFPIHGEINCPESESGMIGDFRWNLTQKELNIKEDNENESRLISVSGVFDIGIHIYDEADLRRIEDVYAVKKNVNLNKRRVLIPKLLMKNNSVCKLSKRMKIADKDSPVIQICNIECDINEELVEPSKDLLAVEGHVFVKVLYASNDERQPFRIANGAIAYSHSLEANGINEFCEYRIRPLIESVAVNQESSDEIEIRVQILMDVIVFDYDSIDIIDDISVSDISRDELKLMPGMIAYTVCEGDTLWDLAKKYHTTTDRLMSINSLNDDGLKSGQRLLIVKELA